MKLTHSIDLDALRAQARVAIDTHYSKLSAATTPLVLIHQAKASAAQQSLDGKSVHPVIASEAATRGVNPLTLANMILLKAADTNEALLQLEVKRLAAKQQVAQATTGQALTSIIRSHQ